MKKTVFLLFFSLQSMLALSQDEVPPDEFIGDLENLLAPVADRITEKNTVLDIGNKQYRVETFKRSQETEAVYGFGQSALKELVDAKSTAAYKKLTLINGLRDTAIFLCRKDFKFPQGDPSQSKIAYSWGSKDHTVRRIPPGTGSTCAYTIHGLDCSGFVYQLFYKNGVKMPVGQCNADTERKVDFLKKYLTPYFGDLAFDVKDMGALAIKDMQSGDIIYFKRANGSVYHIGILFVNAAGEVAFYQSLGKPNMGADHAASCQTNMDDAHGPTVKKLEKSFLEKNSYGCVRIVTDGI